MSEEWGDDAELRGDGSAERGDDPETVLAAFVDAAPRTAAEVADAVDAPADAVAEELAALEERGDLRRTEVPVEGADAAEGDDETLSLWYLPAETLRERASEGLAEADDDVDRALAEMAVPGASRMMRDWRRDAVRAVVEFLREEGPATAAEIRAAVYPPHSAGYDDPDVWWDCVRPRLLSVPGVHREDGVWRSEES
ncbi:hypothetical protein G9464_01505 [Halostella sp. JP-L12]|uniref:hypothetical protein n=1 Tax=Halostella TaxID=1843185 RepID=UPI0013CF167C|nr:MULTISPECIES: hypothetical protein [Halostella]NHN46277.1 hypothetical protein [Halostella sp. JP-L12]